MEWKTFNSNRVILSKLIKILFVFLWFFGIFMAISIKSDVLADNSSSFITEWFWAGNPSDEEIISKLFGDGSAYTRDWDMNIDCTKNMSVVRRGDLPTTLSGNTIYVLSSASITISDPKDIPQCVAIVSSVAWGTTITTVNQITNSWVFTILPNSTENNVIIDSINFDWKYYSTTDAHGLNSKWIYIYWVDSFEEPTYWKNISINNSNISNFDAWIQIGSSTGQTMVRNIMLSNIHLVNNNYWVKIINASDVNINNIIWFWWTGIALYSSDMVAINNANFSVADPSIDIYITENESPTKVAINNVMWDIYTQVDGCYVNNLMWNVLWLADKTCNVYGYHHIFFSWSSYLPQQAKYPNVSVNGVSWTSIPWDAGKWCVTWDVITLPMASNGVSLYNWMSPLSDSSCFVSKPAITLNPTLSKYRFSFWFGVATQIQPIKWSSETSLSDWMTDYDISNFIWWNVTKVTATNDLPSIVTGTTVFTVYTDSYLISKYRLLWPDIESGSNNLSSWVNIWDKTTVKWDKSYGNKTLIVQLTWNNYDGEHFILRTVKKQNELNIFWILNPKSAPDPVTRSFDYWSTTGVVELMDGDITTLTICDPNNIRSCVTLMDRNLWATEAWVWCTTTNTWTCGYLYQWWSNHPHTPTSPITTAHWTWSDSYIHHWYDWPVTGLVRTPIWTNYWEFHENVRWWEGDNSGNNWWFPVTNPTDRKWPCPDGYHVPSKWEWSKMSEYRAISNNIEVVYNEDWTVAYDVFLDTEIGAEDSGNLTQFVNDFKIPFAGYRETYLNSDNWMDVWTIGFYLLSSPFYNGDIYTTCYATLTANGNYPVGYVDNAASIRCFRDVDMDPYSPVTQKMDGDINTLTICDPNNSTECITMMDRNLWATEAWTWCATYNYPSTWACGYYYQWWNNYGFNRFDASLAANSTLTQAVWSPSYSNVGYSWTAFIRTLQWTDYWENTGHYDDLWWWSGDNVGNG